MNFAQTYRNPKKGMPATIMRQVQKIKADNQTTKLSLLRQEEKEKKEAKEAARQMKAEVIHFGVLATNVFRMFFSRFGLSIHFCFFFNIIQRFGLYIEI